MQVNKSGYFLYLIQKRIKIIIYSVEGRSTGLGELDAAVRKLGGLVGREKTGSTLSHP